MLMAQAAGIAPKAVNYVPFDGGGELLASVLGNKVGFGVSGLGEYRDQIEAGELRLLAVTGPKRVPGIDTPTLRGGPRHRVHQLARHRRPARPLRRRTHQAHRADHQAARLEGVEGVDEEERLGRRLPRR
ncbi:hypothetical protein SMICM304S_00655 [Streptomyces microflavus]